MTSQAKKIGVSFQWKGAYTYDGGEISQLEISWERSKDLLQAIASINKNFPTSQTQQVLRITLKKLKDETQAEYGALKFDPAFIKTIQITAHFFKTIKVTREQEDGRLKLESERVVQTVIVPIGKMPPLKQGDDLILTVIHENNQLKATFQTYTVPSAKEDVIGRGNVDFHLKVINAEEELRIATVLLASANEGEDEETRYKACVRIKNAEEALQQIKQSLHKPSSCIVC